MTLLHFIAYHHQYRVYYVRHLGTRLTKPSRITRISMFESPTLDTSLTLIINPLLFAVMIYFMRTDAILNKLPRRYLITSNLSEDVANKREQTSTPASVPHSARWTSACKNKHHQGAVYSTLIAGSKGTRGRKGSIIVAHLQKLLKAYLFEYTKMCTYV